MKWSEISRKAAKTQRREREEFDGQERGQGSIQYPFGSLVSVWKPLVAPGIISPLETVASAAGL
jgi:hypothetical protein